MQGLPPHPLVNNPEGDNYIRATFMDPSSMDDATTDTWFDWIYLSHYTQEIPAHLRFRFRGESTRIRIPSPPPNDSPSPPPVKKRLVRRSTSTHKPPKGASLTQKPSTQRKVSAAQRKLSETRPYRRSRPEAPSHPPPKKNQDALDEAWGRAPSNQTRKSSVSALATKARLGSSRDGIDAKLVELSDAEDFAAKINQVVDSSDSQSASGKSSAVAAGFAYYKFGLPAVYRNPTYKPTEVQRAV